MTVQTDVQQLSPGSLIQLFVVDMSVVGGGMLRFHEHLQAGPIVWQGNSYSPWPLQTEGFARTSSNNPSPSLTLANVDRSISALCMAYEDLVGAKVTRLRTLSKYLDAVNFVGPDLAVTWNPYTGTSVQQDNEVLIGQAAGSAAIEYVLPTVIGRTYRLTFNVLDTVCFTRVGTTQNGTNLLAQLAATLGANTRTFVATTTTSYVTFLVGALGAALPSRIGQVEVREELGNPTADPGQQMPPEVWYVERKVSEDNRTVQFELASAMDLNGMQLPRRQIVANKCLWLTIGGYRGAYCNYSGPPVAKADDTATSDPLLDRCGGRIVSCKKRFGEDGQLNHGGFPAAGMVR